MDGNVNMTVAMRILYKKSSQYIYMTYFTRACIFIINLIIIVTKIKESSFAIWGILGVVITIILVNLYCSVKAKELYELGEKIRILDIIKKAFPNANNKAEESYIKNNLPSKILFRAKTNEDSTEYYSNRTDKYEKLIEHIQENCFFTSALMKSYAKIILVIIMFLSIILILSILYGFFSLSENNNYKLVKGVADSLAIFVNFLFALNILNHYSLFNKKSLELKQLDSALESHKHHPNEENVIIYFTKYNCILNDALPCPDWIYDLNKEKLNMIWKQRIDK